MHELTIALAKGRLADQCLRFFEGTSIEAERAEDSRKLVFFDASGSIRYIFVKPSDVITYVEKGVADLGFVGKDMILEEDKDIYELMDLGFGRCHFAVAGYPNWAGVKKDEVLRVATSYPNYAAKVFKAKGRPVDIIHLHGSIELAPIIGLSDVIVDIVETGNTLRENGLVVLENLAPISVRLISNKASYRLKFELVKKLEAILGGRR